MNIQNSVGRIMTSPAVTCGPEDSILSVATVIVRNGFNGLPVVDKEQKLIGIITEYDFILKNQNIHLPTLIKIFQDVDIYKKDAQIVREDIQSLMNIKVSDVMNREPLSVKDSDSLDSLVEIFAEHHKINPIPVVNNEGFLVGVVSRHDILRFFAGNPMVVKKSGSSSVDEKSVSEFIKNMDRNFMLVSRARTSYWLVASILFTLVGFSIAWFLILRINF